MQSVQQCLAESWSPTIGDPTALGWITVACYALAAVLSARAALRLSGPDRLLWFAVAFLMVLLCVNKQLDLQSALTALARCHAQLHGWYENRRTIQVTVILGMVGIIALAFAVYVLIGWRQVRRNALLFVGLFVLMTFVATRAIGFHRIDQFINWLVLGVRMNHVLELGAISAIMLAALLKRRT